VINTVQEEYDGLIFRNALPPSGQAIRRILVLLHGWTGDENAMWVFIPGLPPNTLIISPRGFVNARPTGYGWFEHPEEGLSTPLSAYHAAVDKTLAATDGWMKIMGIPAVPIHLMGFSQGAAVAAVMALMYPERVERTAMLAGFLHPAIIDSLHPGRLHGKQYFIAHGRKDDVIPFSSAETAVAALRYSGAIVEFCPSEAGHKLSLDCLNGLKEFFDL
jgi:phospholipase/carboxylesterase